MRRKSIGLVVLWAAAALAMCARPAWAITIQVDYRYDSNHFFDTNPGTTLNPDGAAGAQQARDALAAAASRFSAIITRSLTVVNLVDDATDGRIGFTHPGTGASYQVSAAASAATDDLVTLGGVPAANEYRNGFHLDSGQWVLYAGARGLSAAAVGGSGTGTNWTTVFDDPNSHLNRGFNVGAGSLPVWGGGISFDNDGSTPWHFDHTAASPSGEVDFYSTALHELGHTLGLCTTWNDFKQYVTGSSFTGPHAVAMLNHDNGTAVTAVPLQSATNLHWNDNSDGGSYRSYIFAAADPNLVGTVGTGTLQDLLMEPVGNFVYPTVRRFELTNLDVGALEDVGWEVVPMTLIPGDATGDGKVDEDDAATVAAHWGQSGGWSDGDSSGDGRIDAADASILAANWGHGASEAAVAPEPGVLAMLVAGALLCAFRRTAG